MANAFNKQETVLFEKRLQEFEDALVLSKMVNVFDTDQQLMERSGDKIWRPMPYIMASQNGPDMSSYFLDTTQLSVPSVIDTEKSVPFYLTAKQQRDAIQSGSLGKSAIQKLASDVNVALSAKIALYGSLFAKQSAAATGYADAALCDAIMNEQGVPMHDRYLGISSRDHIGMGTTLVTASGLPGKIPTNAYENARIGRIAGFEMMKLDYATYKAAKAASGVTVNGNQYHVPSALVSGTTNNQDNRTMTLNVNSGTAAVNGDAFTIAGVYAVHHITKQSTGQLKTFRIVSGGESNAWTITPSLVSNTGDTQAELMYKNVDAQAATGAAITFLNTVAGYQNPFWCKEAVEIIPGRYVVDEDSGVGVMRAVTESGLELVVQKQYDINTMKTKYRYDILFGVNVLNTEMCGVIQFSQT